MNTFDMKKILLLAALTAALGIGYLLCRSTGKCTQQAGCTAFDTSDAKGLGMNGIPGDEVDDHDVRNIEVVADSTWVRADKDGWWFHSMVRVSTEGRRSIAEHEARAMITLPTGCKLESARFTDLSGHTHPWRQCGASIEAMLPALDEADVKDYRRTMIEVRTTKPATGPSACAQAFSIHVFSNYPDGDPTDNYWWWRAQCGNGSDDRSPDSTSWGPHPFPR